MIVKKFKKTSLPEKEDFYSHSDRENITNADYAHGRGVCQDFEIKNLDFMICIFKAMYYCLLMDLRTLEIFALKYMNFILQNVFQLLNWHGK